MIFQTFNSAQRNKKYQNFNLIFFLFLLFFFTFSCSKKSIPIIDRSKNYYSKFNTINRDKYKKYSQKNSQNIARFNKIIVQKNENIYLISKKYQIPLRDLIKENKLTPPYQLKAGDVLIISAPIYHQVEAGDTLYSIARNYNMNLDSLVELNDLKAPYQIIIGQKIRIHKYFTNSSGEEKKLVDNPNSSSERNSSSQIIERNLFEKTSDRLSKFSWPIYGKVVSKFGPKERGLFNDGINIQGKIGDSVKASQDGIVSYVGNELKGYGNLIIIKHSDGWITAYAHLSKFSVKRGQKVKKLAKIGEVGNSGNVDFAQLYFGLRKGREAVNPENYLSK